MRTPVFCRMAGIVICLMLAGSAVWAAYCAKCGGKLPERARFCPMCGERVPEAAPVSPAVPASAPGVTETFYPDGTATTAPRPVRLRAASTPLSPEKTERAEEPVGSQDIGTVSGNRYSAGTLKVGSTPIECIVTFRGHGYEKTKGVLVFDQVPPGRYTISFSRDGRVLDKVVEVRPGKSSFVYGNLARAVPKPQTPPAQAPSAKGMNAGVPGERLPVDGEPAGVATAAADGAIAAEPVVLPGKEIKDADDKFLLAETLRKSVNPFTKKERYDKARRLYLEIIERWPGSDKIEQCHYHLGQIYESMYYGKHRKAIGKYMDVLRLNPHTRYCVRWRIAVLYDNRLGMKTSAREWYEQAAGLSPRESVRQKAAKAAKLLRKQGF